MKIVLITTMYERHKLTDFIFGYYSTLKNKLIGKIDLILLACGSEGIISENIAKKNDFDYLEYENFPLSSKHNALLLESKKYDPNGVLLIGSDDFISEHTFLKYYDLYKNGVDFIGFKDLYMYDGILHYWGGYTNDRFNEPIGAGRFFSKKLLDMCNWDLWGDININKGLDSICYKKIKNLNIKKEVILCDNQNNFIVDIKTEKNITKLKNFNSQLKKIYDKKLMRQLNIDINYLDNNIINIKKPKVSIIIPTYKNTQYIDECLNSIIESGKNYNIEVLVGIDACDETLTYIKTKTYPDFIKFYYFRENNGPYLIFNSLSQIASSNKLLFFGSDDIMTKITIGEVVNNLDTYDLVRLRYQNYVGHSPIGNTSNFGEGAFSINKNIFLSLNGFEPWRVAADSDFMGRIYKMRLKIYHTREIAFYYRQHPTSLTKRPDTGMGSSLRANYAKISKNKRNNVNPDKLHTSDFDYVDVTTYTVEIDQTQQKQLEEQRRIREEKLNSVFNKTVRKQVEVVNKKNDPVIIDRLDFLYKKTPESTRVIKTNTPQDRQELINQKNNTNKNTIKKMFDFKPNYREGKNFINLGGKINK